MGQTKSKNGEAVAAAAVILDARPDFQYSVAHIHGAISMHWQDFAQNEEPFLGLLEPDLFFHARRLARLGIRPFTPVIVVGRGQQGEGEEGRLAWTLRVMGLQDVKFTSIDTFSVPLSAEPAPERPAAQSWIPQVDDTLTVTRENFVKKVMTPGGSDRATVIDVRSELEYLGKDTHSRFSRQAPDVGAINIPWTQFLNSQGEVNSQIKRKLEQVGIAPDKVIYVIDDFGVRSAVVTLVLRDLGFAKAANFAGGYMQLLAK